MGHDNRGKSVIVTLKHIDRTVSKGTVYFYFRYPGLPRIRLPGKPGDSDFMAAYNDAIAALPKAQIADNRLTPFSMAHLASLYYETAKYKVKSDGRRSQERRWLDAFMKDYGHLPAKTLRTHHLDKIFASMTDRPAAAMNWRKALRNLTRLMIKIGWRTDDPISETDTFKGGTHHSWNEDEVEQYQKYWKLGTRQRAAFDLALYTGQRRSDLHRMTWTDISGGLILVNQMKTKETVYVPLHTKLIASLQALGRRHIAIIVTEFGKPFSQAGFGNWMADNIERAGLPKRCVLHGLRKAAAARLAEAGCTEKEIASITGHKTLKEVARYTAAARQKVLARSAMHKLEEDKGGTDDAENLPNLFPNLIKLEKKQ